MPWGQLRFILDNLLSRFRHRIHFGKTGAKPPEKLPQGLQREGSHIPIVTSYGENSVLSAAKPALAPVPLQVLLVGNKEEDFYLIREILERTRSLLAAELDHAHSLEEAKGMLQHKSY